jgi:penicillin amidase
MTRRSPSEQAAVAARSEPSPTASPRGRLRFALRALTALGILLLIAVLLFTAYLRHAMHANLAQIEGTLHVPGLSAPVSVERDVHGVPSLHAATLDDLLFAQGFVTAQDRLWQMDAVRRHAAGELAEILGSNLLDHDRTQRVLQLRNAADRALLQLPADQRHQLEAYARGVNAYITSANGRLPVEFALLHYQPAPWQPRDSLLVAFAMAQDLGTTFPTKLLRESFSAHMPADLLADLYPVGTSRDRPPNEAVPDLTAPQPDVPPAPLDESQSSLHAPRLHPQMPGAQPQELLAVAQQFRNASCADCRAGSNNWAVAGTRSASGMPLVANDMHLALGVPDIWYTIGLNIKASSLNVAGVSLPGVPFVIVGRNAHVAWGFTNLGGDAQDLYIEHTRGTGAAMEFERADGTWQPMLHHAELIRVRGGRDQTLDVVCTTHNAGAATLETPVITPLYAHESRTLSLAWTVYDASAIDLPLLAVAQAANGQALAAAFAKFNAPSLNLIFADDAGHIGYHAVGNIPVRGPAAVHPAAQSPLLLTQSSSQDAADGSGAADENAPTTPVLTIGSPIPPTPVDALDINAQWSGYVPYAALPAVNDPPSGVLATANARVTPDNYPYTLALGWAPAFRVDRIVRTLLSQSRATPEDMRRLQNDVYSDFDLTLAHRLAYALDQTPPSTDKKLNARRATAANLLRAWDGNVTADSPAAAIVVAARGELWSMLLTPQVAAHDHIAADKTAGIVRLYSWETQTAALERILLLQPPRWLPQQFANWNTFLVSALDRGLVATRAPEDLTQLHYGRLHPVELRHALLSMSPLLAHLLGTPVGSGLLALGGDGTTVKASSHSFGPSQRFVADMGNSTTWMTITTGESGNPASDYYLDQLSSWVRGEALPLTSPTAHTLTLAP